MPGFVRRFLKNGGAGLSATFETTMEMTPDNRKLTVYYDGNCPSCIKDRHDFEKLSDRYGRNIVWFDITGQDEHLRNIGIDPIKALTELHIQTENQEILSEIDAYVFLMSKVPLLRPVSWLIGRSLIRPVLAKIYHRRVHRRLIRSGRLQRTDR